MKQRICRIGSLLLAALLALLLSALCCACGEEGERGPSSPAQTATDLPLSGGDASGSSAGPAKTEDSPVPADTSAPSSGSGTEENDPAINASYTEGELRVKIDLPGRAGEEASVLLLKSAEYAGNWREKAEEALLDLAQARLDENGACTVVLRVKIEESAFLTITVGDEEHTQEVHV